MSSNTSTQSDYLVSPGTIAEADGQGPVLELGMLVAKPLLMVLRIAETIEQESLHISIWASADGSDWGSQALFWYPEKFYRGATPAVLDLRQKPEVRFLQARWEVNRWGRGYPRPHFNFSMEVQELTTA
jgi:hypothetical protein